MGGIAAPSVRLSAAGFFSVGFSGAGFCFSAFVSCFSVFGAGISRSPSPCLEPGDDFADTGLFAGLFQDLGEHARGRGRQFKGRLFAFQLDQRLAGLHEVAFGFQPVAEINFRDRFADFRHFEFNAHKPGHSS